MKKFFLLLLLALPGLAAAQFFTHTDQRAFYNTILEMRADTGGVLHLAVVEDGNLGTAGLYLQRLDASGAATDIHLMHFGPIIGWDFLPVANGYIDLGVFFECDIYTPPTLQHIDLNNAFLTQIWLEDIDPFRPFKLLPGPDTTFWVFRENRTPLRYDYAGNRIDTGTVVLPVFKGFLRLSDDRLLTHGDAGLDLYNPSLTFHQSRWFGNAVLDADTLPGGDIVALTQDSLFRLDADFNTIQSAALGFSFLTVSWDLSAADGNIWLLKKDSPAYLYRYNADLQLQETQFLPADKPFLPALIHAAPGRTVLGGKGRHLNSHAAQVIAARATPPGEVDLEASADAALLDITAPYGPKGLQLPNQPGWYAMWMDSAFVTVQNLGPEPLERVTINGTLVGYGWFCGWEEQHVQHTFTGLNIAPGESATLLLPLFSWSYPYTGIPANYNLCLWTTRPNGQLDAVLNNDRACRSFAVTVAIADPGFQPAPLSIVPNPIENTARITWGSQEPALLRIFDSMGKLVRTDAQAQTPWTFERGDLPAGVYTVLIVDQYGKGYAGRGVVR